jgi:ABC-type transport system involved in multi-copper enzyme maturation permease subunit
MARLPMQKSVVVQQAYKRPRSATFPRMQPLWSVMGWELFRYREMRFSKFLILGIALFFVLGAWSWASAYTYLPYASTSVLGMTLEIPTTFSWTLAVTTPFLVADLVTRDRKLRVHELVMTTAIPTWAYVWGRYLAGLGVCLALAVLALPLILLMNGIFFVLQPHATPASNVGAIVALWIITVLPILLVTGLSFCLCTLLPRRATLLKLLVLMGWLIAWYSGAVVGWSVVDGQSPPEQVAAWDPTTISMPLQLMREMYVKSGTLSSSAGTHALDAQRAIVAQQSLPDLMPWLLTHLLYAVLGLLLVALTALLFKRFRNALD